ncbi:MAG TPA: fumarylacetoacetate hydrolase family protein [Burkholderiales bacterium]|nr:fumarylacetoacetate hydrolase family protein [Burkholderiales bacterium]
MKLVTFEVEREARPGRMAGDEIVDLRSLAPDVRGILAGGLLEKARSASGRTYALKQVKLLAPIPNPGMVLSVGMNYHEHLREMKTPVPGKPAAFTKSVASIIGPDAPIRIPPSNPDMLDWEGEFSVVIGKPCHRVRASQALDCVAGYTIVNDVSARDWVAPIFSATGIMGPIHAWEHNILGKMFPTFCPMGPVLATKDEVPDPANVKLQTRLNGKVMQDANTDDLVFSVVQLIEYYSQFYLFQPGDVITTGSPSGVGYGRNPKVFMKAGDVVEVEVEGIGVLRNPIA